MSNFSINEKISDIKDVLQQLGNTSVNLLNENNELKKDKERLEQKIQKSEEQFTNLKNKKDNEIKNLENLWNTHIGNLEYKIKEMGETYGKPIAIAEENKKREEELDKKEETLNKKAQDLEKKDNALNRESKRIEKEKNDFEKERAYKDNKINTLNEDNKNLTEQLKAEQTKNKELSDSVEVKENEKKVLKDSNDKLKNANKELEEKIAEYKQTITEKDNEIINLKNSQETYTEGIKIEKSEDIGDSTLIVNAKNLIKNLHNIDELKKSVKTFAEYKNLLWLYNLILKNYPGIFDDDNFDENLDDKFKNIEKFRDAISFIKEECQENIKLYTDIITKCPDDSKRGEFWDKLESEIKNGSDM